MQKSISILVGIFLIITGILFFFNQAITNNGVNTKIVQIGNIICLILHIITFLIQYKSLSSPNPRAFVMAAMGTITAKLLFCMMAVLVYIITAKASVNKPAVMVLFVVYLLYMAMELRLILKLNKAQKNG